MKKMDFHCYSGTLSTMKAAIDLGFYISLATVLCRSPQHQVLAKNVSLDLPLAIHSRDTEQKALEMVKNLEKVVFHCYSGTLTTMREATDRGFYISLATVLCRSPQHQILAKNVSLDHLLVETDSPFLSPRHGRNEPSYILDSIRLIAKIRGMDPQEVARITSENTRRIYDLR
jgi:TatD DNase family protein